MYLYLKICIDQGIVAIAYRVGWLIWRSRPGWSAWAGVWGARGVWSVEWGMAWSGRGPRSGRARVPIFMFETTKANGILV